ncbi:phage tail sheath subtilisin-like domain-containing protein [bacterium]|nr:phage tail sheath subtilisin-like domain-containing protein [bacterium]
MARTIQSPGVEIKEVDLSLRPDIPVGTTVLISGFSQNGPTDELIQVTSASDFEQIYGAPTTPVERYFYHTVRASLNSPANVYVSRMPYGAGAGSDRADKYSALVYPVFPKPKTSELHKAHGLYEQLVQINASRLVSEIETHTFNFSTPGGLNSGSIKLQGGASSNEIGVTASIPYSATDVEVKAAIESLPGINEVNVSVANPAQALGDGQMVITYENPKYRDVVDMTVHGGSSLANEVAGVNEQFTINILPDAEAVAGFWDLTIGTWTAIGINITANASDIKGAIEGAFAANTSAGANVTVTSSDGSATTTVADHAAGTGGSFTITIDNPVGPTGGQSINWGTVSNGLTPAAVPVSTNIAITSVIPGVAPVLTPTVIDPITYVDGTGDPTDLSEIYQSPAACKLIVEYVRENGWDLVDADAYYFGEPSNLDIDGEQYRAFQENRADFGTKAGHVTEWKTYDDLVTQGGMGFILLNTKKLSINEKFEGFYIGVLDNTNLNPASDFDGMLKLKGFNQYTYDQRGASYIDVPENRLNFGLSAAPDGLAGSVSEVIENIPSFDIANHQYSDVLTLGVFKVRPSTLNPDISKLDYVLSEGHLGSFNFYAQQYLQEGGTPTSFFVQDETAGARNYRIIVNPNISKNGGDWYDEDKNVTKKVRVASAKRLEHYGPTSTAAEYEATKQTYIDNAFLDDKEADQLFEFVQALNTHAIDYNLPTKYMPAGYNMNDANAMYAHGAFKKADGNSAETGNIPSKLARMFEAAENLDLYPLDILCEAGLGTVYVGTGGGDTDDPVTKGRFDDEKFYDIDHLYNTQVQAADDIMANYKTIANMFINFCGTLRKDCMVVLDNLRYIWVQGENVRVLDDKHNKNFSKHIYWPLRHLFGTINSSYAATYGNWVKVQDPAINKQVWMPPSGFAAAAMANTDSNFQPWYAPAGFTRGILSNINDVAFMPKQKHRDQMYKIGINPIAMFPNDGFVIFGQKTLQSKPSAFDRINVRRMFLFAERAVRQTIKYFVFEPNTLFTRQQVINVLTPIFERIKNTQGLYDYMIVCDDRNNPPDVIDQNEMVVDIYLKPVRSAEFILVNFYATRTSQDFSELIA